MTRVDFEVLLDKYLNGKASPAETKLLDQFFDSYRSQAGDFDETSEGIKGEILQNIRISIDNRKITHQAAVARADAVISFFRLPHTFYRALSEPKNAALSQN